MNKKGKVYGSV
ncbi:hypothetical protein Nmel_007979, partial [Mimus melanotis]